MQTLSATEIPFLLYTVSLQDLDEHGSSQLSVFFKVAFLLSRLITHLGKLHACFLYALWVMSASRWNKGFSLLLPKLSNVGPDQYIDGWPLGNTKFCKMRCENSVMANGSKFLIGGPSSNSLGVRYSHLHVNTLRGPSLLFYPHLWVNY